MPSSESSTAALLKDHSLRNSQRLQNNESPFMHGVRRSAPGRGVVVIFILGGCLSDAGGGLHFEPLFPQTTDKTPQILFFQVRTPPPPTLVS